MLTRLTSHASEPGQALRGATRTGKRVPVPRYPSASLGAGVLVFVLGFAGDLGYHLAPRELMSSFEPLLGFAGHNAHLVTLIGMILILASVMWRGIDLKTNLAREGQDAVRHVR